MYPGVGSLGYYRFLSLMELKNVGCLKVTELVKVIRKSTKNTCMLIQCAMLLSTINCNYCSFVDLHLCFAIDFDILTTLNELFPSEKNIYVKRSDHKSVLFLQNGNL